MQEVPADARYLAQGDQGPRRQNENNPGLSKIHGGVDMIFVGRGMVVAVKGDIFCGAATYISCSSVCLASPIHGIPRNYERQ